MFLFKRRKRSTARCTACRQVFVANSEREASHAYWLHCLREHTTPPAS